MKVIRVFPQRTSYTPDDEDVYIGEPPGLFMPECDEIHISCVFTWDMDYCEWLKGQWEFYTEKPVRLGGPAYNSPCDTFKPGVYLRQGITITSRGCNNKCPWCMVPKREGCLKELPVTEGNIVQDNNFLQCSVEHKNRVFEMLKKQTRVSFKGGLQANLVDEHFIGNAKELSIKELWLSCDTDNAFPAFSRACEKLKSVGYTRNHIRCYVLIGRDENMNQAEDRLMCVYETGAMPFAQLYQPEGKKIEYSSIWNKFHRAWCRPAAISAMCEHGTDFRDFGT